MRRTRIQGEGERPLFAWAYQFKTQLPRPVSFRYRVQPTREGPFDRLVRRMAPGEVIRGSVVLATSGPVWIDAVLLGDR